MKKETRHAAHRACADTAEGRRLADSAQGGAWRRFGPYLSERQWGTVREDYSADGDAWAYFPHDHARSRAYRWGEDGIGGFADDKLHLCLSLALWNGRDAILKERLFGLNNVEGNHGEDVKEVYHYLDAAPSHAYMKMLYKYPQRAFPYDELVRVNAARGLGEDEYDLADAGAFDEDRYFDVEIDYAKAAPDDVLMRITAHNRGPDPAALHLLPQVFFRNVWSWRPSDRAQPRLAAQGDDAILVDHFALEPMILRVEGGAELLFCDNDTNRARLYGAHAGGFAKDGVNDHVVSGAVGAVNPARRGTKAAAHRVVTLAAGASHTMRLRLSPRAQPCADAFAEFDAIFALRLAETNAFYDALAADDAFALDADAARVRRQAYAGMLWSKQFYGYDVRRWLNGDPLQPPPPAERAAQAGRNVAWAHLAMGDIAQDDLGDIVSMPDKWEYPWFAAWDLAFQAIVFARIDAGFAKSQLILLTQARALHPNGQMPAYEWNFGDVNPPVHAWAAWRIYEIDRAASGEGDLVFLERVFQKLALNFTWWVNRVDADGRNIFQGGFLGLDNVGLFDLRKPLPGGGFLDQSDGTAWAASYALSMLRIALELAGHNRVYEDLATKFFEHFLYIAEAIHKIAGPTPTGLWDEQDQFYYDVLRSPGRPPRVLRIRSIVGLIPLFAVEALRIDFDAALPQFAARMDWFVRQRPDLAGLVSNWRQPNAQGVRLLSLLRKHRLNALLTRMLDETEFLSDHGVRSVSKFHAAHPYSFEQDGETFSLSYEPGLGATRIYGGNSNWRGPVWMPINFLIVESLRKFHRYYGDEFQMALPTGGSRMATLDEIADELARRLQRLFLRDADGRRAYLGARRREQSDPRFRDAILFHEYFHGDTGEGLGASHQTGWTGLIAALMGTTPTTDG